MLRAKTHWGRLAAIAVLGVSLAACSGDDGKNGADGAPGPEGPTGPAGPEGPAGPGASITPLESCNVCHSEGSVASAPAAHQVFDIASFADFAVTPDGADLVVSFSVTADGAPATAATFFRAYFFDGVVRTTLTGEIEADLANLFSNNGDGTYSVRIVDGVARFGGTNGRYLAILRTGLNQLEVAAVGDYPAAIPLAGLASNESCAGCHGASGEVGRFAPTRRGGHYSAPMSADACVVCHLPDNPATPEDDEPSYMRLVRVVHGIHNSHNFPDGEFVSDRGNAYDVTYPTYMLNCSVCHDDDNVVPATGGSALAAANAMTVSGANCFTCHGGMDSWDFSGPPDLTFHNNIADPENADCATACHDGGIAPATVVSFHNGLAPAFRRGPIFDGVDVSVDEGEKFDWQITGIVDDGTNLAISWTASYDGVGVDPCNDAVAAGAPAFHNYPGSNLSMLRSYAQGDDFIIGMSTSAPGQALAVDVTTDNTTCAGNVATTTILVDAGVTAERGIVALQGRPWVESPLDPATAIQVRAATPTYEWTVGDGAAPLMARRDIVDNGECLTCHVGSLYQHGGDRIDNVGMCILCHNSASNEKSVRVGMGVDASEAYDGRSGETFEMKTMLHRIHSAGVDGQPHYVLYRNRGIYAYGPDESAIPNWPGTGQQPVFGSDDGTGNPVLQNHNFHSADYSRALNACDACHVESLAVQPDQTQAMATTVEAGSEVWENQLDDVLQGATTTACVSCHADAASKGHSYQNSWDPQEFPEGRQTIIDAAN